MTWFTKLSVYRLTQDVPAFARSGQLGLHTDFSALNEALHTRPSRPLAAQELSTYGFAPPFKARPLTLADREEPSLLDDLEPALPQYVQVIANRYLLVMTKRCEKMLPGNVIKREVAKRVEKIELEQLRKVYKKERDQLKDEVITEFLGRAFDNEKLTYACIDTQLNLIYINDASPRSAEDLLSTLREALGSLPVRPVGIKLPPSASMTDWVRNQKAPEDFYILDSALLKDTEEDGGKVGLSRQDLTNDATQLHLAEGKLVTKLHLAFKDQISFVLDDRFLFTSIRYEDLLKERAALDGGEDALCQLQAGAFIMFELFSELIPRLMEELGGEEIPQGL